ncbi:DUF4123 domain-containing protein [Vitiosangium sp. GDMCC 1.1324]|uniref:DUF4123 domain-containing protein n=1 Tax=Vitiosangium sp. (strain GDMCC 1.1324) TaxID=2138576 RepID=UPI000D3C1C15|nr:DUF4123 domain-containing protein [Vitiosangium sp. GDMCC 1.1324]PTL79435.1 DUF4123 domain-containing protein [Vitiosangium sp. GDMCC 1.1324]
MPPSHVEKILQCVWPPPKARNLLDVYVLLDSARDESIIPTLQDTDLEVDCLFSGVMPAELSRAAPYLVRLRRSSPFTPWLAEHSWSKSWGVYLQATGDREAVRKHLQSLLLVRTEQGKELFFRYYDPRVLRVYLPTCTAQEVQQMFGPVRSFFAEGEDGASLVQYAMRAAAQQLSPLEVTVHPVA